MDEELGNDSLLWDDETWAFPKLGGEEEQRKQPADVSNSAGQVAAKDEEVPPPAAKGRKRTAASRREEGGGESGGESDDHELHIWTERERRKKMRNMFANLHALLPHIPPKADKSTVVDEAVKYIKRLEQTLQDLEKRKLDHHNPSTNIQSREAFLAQQGGTFAGPSPLFPGPAAIFKTWTSPNVILNVCGRDAHISVCGITKPALLTAICFVLEKHHLDLVSAQISSNRTRFMCIIHALARAKGGADQLFQQVIPVEEIYKQAAAEIMLWLNS